MQRFTLFLLALVLALGLVLAGCGPVSTAEPTQALVVEEEATIEPTSTPTLEPELSPTSTPAGGRTWSPQNFPPPEWVYGNTCYDMKEGWVYRFWREDFDPWTNSGCFISYSESLNFDWGEGSPESSMPTDGFTAVFAKNAIFTPGIYKFRYGRDDGLIVWVEDGHGWRQVHDSWLEGAAEGEFDVELSGEITIVVAFREGSGAANLHVEVIAPEYYPGEG